MKRTPKERLEFLEENEQEFLSLREHYERQHVAVSAWQKLIGGSNGPGKLVVLDPADVFCEDGECPLYNKETSFYLDDDHASTNGFGRLENLIGETIFGE